MPLFRPCHALNCRSPGSVVCAEWSPSADLVEERLPECNDSLLVLHDRSVAGSWSPVHVMLMPCCFRGPMVLLQLYLGILSQGLLSPLALVNEYIRHHLLTQAVNLLCSLNWNQNGRLCMACLSAIANHLLRDTLNPQNEGEMNEWFASALFPVWHTFYFNTHFEYHSNGLTTLWNLPTACYVIVTSAWRSGFNLFWFVWAQDYAKMKKWNPMSFQHRSLSQDRNYYIYGAFWIIPWMSECFKCLGEWSAIVSWFSCRTSMQSINIF